MGRTDLCGTTTALDTVLHKQTGLIRGSASDTVLIIGDIGVERLIQRAGILFGSRRCEDGDSTVLTLLIHRCQ